MKYTKTGNNCYKIAESGKNKGKKVRISREEYENKTGGSLLNFRRKKKQPIKIENTNKSTQQVQQQVKFDCQLPLIIKLLTEILISPIMESIKKSNYKHSYNLPNTIKIDTWNKPEYNILSTVEINDKCKNINFNNYESELNDSANSIDDKYFSTYVVSATNINTRKKRKNKIKDLITELIPKILETSTESNNVKNKFEKYFEHKIKINQIERQTTFSIKRRIDWKNKDRDSNNPQPQRLMNINKTLEIENNNILEIANELNQI